MFTYELSNESCMMRVLMLMQVRTCQSSIVSVYEEPTITQLLYPGNNSTSKVRPYDSCCFGARTIKTACPTVLTQPITRDGNVMMLYDEDYLK